MAKGSRARRRARMDEQRQWLKKVIPGYIPTSFALLSGDLAIASAGRPKDSQHTEEVKKDG